MLAVALAAAAPLRAADPAGALRLCALDCGHASFKDSGFFSDTGEYDGKPGALAVPTATRPTSSSPDSSARRR